MSSVPTIDTKSVMSKVFLIVNYLSKQLDKMAPKAAPIGIDDVNSPRYSWLFSDGI